MVQRTSSVNRREAPAMVEKKKSDGRRASLALAGAHVVSSPPAARLHSTPAARRAPLARLAPVGTAATRALSATSNAAALAAAGATGVAVDAVGAAASSAASAAEAAIALPRRVAGVAAASVSAMSAAASSAANVAGFAAAALSLAGPSGNSSGQNSSARTTVRHRMTIQRAALLERCAVRIQKTWRASTQARNVAWIRLINDDARRRHAARQSFQLRVVAGAGSKSSPRQILREAQEDILASVRKCFHSHRVVDEMVPAAQQHKRLRDAVHRRLGALRAKTQTAEVFLSSFQKAHQDEEHAESMWEMLAASLGAASLATGCGSHGLAAASLQLADLRRAHSPSRSAKSGKASRPVSMFRRPRLEETVVSALA